MGHENEFGTLYGDVMAWVGKEFGSERDPKGIIMKMDEEMDELWRAIERWQKGWRDKEEMYAEVADLMILVVNLAGDGIGCRDVFKDREGKLEVKQGEGGGLSFLMVRGATREGVSDEGVE
jgi:phosphoribosyl-ATP pyrophosphohydrolase